MKIYRCNRCGKIITLIQEGVTRTICCNEEMKEIVPKTSDELDEEKHLPIVETDGDNLIVTIGKNLHPNNRDHHIDWIIVEFENGFQIKYIDKNTYPTLVIKLCRRDKVKAIYAYCNIHGLWKTEVDI